MISDTSSPHGDKRRDLFLLRGMLIVAVGALLIDTGVHLAGAGALALILLFAASNAAIPFLRPRLFLARRFELVIGALDIVLVGLGISLAGTGAGALPVSCLLMVVIVALGRYKAHTVAGATAVAAMHVWFIFSMADGAATGRQVFLQTLFLCCVGLYYGFLTEGLHRLREEKASDQLERKELSALLDILGHVTSSLDVRQVTGAIVERLTSLVPAVRCSIIHVDETMTRCFVMASHDNPDLDMLEVKLDRYPEIRHAIETRQPVIIPDITDHPLMTGVRKYLDNMENQSVLAIPILFCDKLLGTLCLRSVRSGEGFTDRDIKLCTAAARVSANALRNAFMHRRISEEADGHRLTSEKLARIFDHSPDIIITTDKDGRIAEFNRGAEMLLGYTKDEITGEPYHRLLLEEGENPYEQVRSEKVLPDHECNLVKKNGESLDIRLHLTELYDARDGVTGTLWIGRDVSELRNAQMQLMQAEKLSSIGEVISGVTHELNNPLSGVLGYSQLLMARHGDTPIARDLQKVYDSALRCQKIVKNLLSFSRANKPERKLLGVNGILEKTLDLKKYQLHVHGIEVVKDLDRDLPGTMLDFHQAQQVFLNIINNAQHAMEKVRGREKRLEIRSAHVDGKIVVEISDNGEGIDPGVIHRIFDPFFTTKGKEEGTGLGLSVSYGIVKEHGGEIRVASRKNEGTSFVIELPVIKSQEHSGREEIGSDIGMVENVSRCRILVVDDEPTIVDLLLDILEEVGHRVDTASNGNEARRKLEGNHYDLVITDVRMPTMNGLDLYRDILSKRPELKARTIFITGDLLDDEIVDFLAEVEARTIPKPLDITKVRETVRELLAS